MHFHKKARQFFFIISGSATFEIDGQTHIVKRDEGIEIVPGTKHCIYNNSNKPLEFVVISEPATKGDRYE